MKHSPHLRLIGFVFIVTSLLGILISVLGIGFVWIARPRVQRSLSNTLGIVNDTLHTTNESLLLMGDVIDLTIININTIETTIKNLDGTITSVSDSLDTTSTLIGKNLKQTLIDTQTTLSSASQSAELIDNTLFFLASVPFIGVDYEPEVPLHTSLEQVSANLEEIPDSLEKMEQTLNSAADGLDILNTDLLDLSGDISKFDGDLTDAKDLLDDYKSIIEETENKTLKLSENIGLYTVLACVIISVLLLWSLIFHSSIFLQGWHYLKGEPKIVNLADLQREKIVPENNNTDTDQI